MRHLGTRQSIGLAATAAGTGAAIAGGLMIPAEPVIGVLWLVSGAFAAVLGLLDLVDFHAYVRRRDDDRPW